MRGEIEKQFMLARDCANRQRPLPTFLTTTRAAIPGNGSRSTRRRIAQTVTNGHEPAGPH